MCPRCSPAADVLAGIAVLPQRVHRYDYRRAAFGDAWDDDNDAPGGHNGCDTRDDILNRDLVDKTYVSIKRCPGRGGHRHAARPVHQHHHRLPARRQGRRIGADRPHRPAGLRLGHGGLRLAGSRAAAFRQRSGQLAGRRRARPIRTRATLPPAQWMPPNTAFACQYAMQFIAVLRGYQLPVDQASVGVLRQAAATCPTG